jgi:FkbM family methyltransferase
LAFEPDPENFKLLEMTQNEANAKNLEIYPYALSNQTGDTSFSQDTLTSATGCIAGKDMPWIEQYLNGSSNTISVKTQTLDSVAKEDKIPSLIKIDVEGHEIEVLDGGKNTLVEKNLCLSLNLSHPNKPLFFLSCRNLDIVRWMRIFMLPLILTQPTFLPGILRAPSKKLQFKN